ncbi:MAG: ABC transporter permease, partial [Candidatus Amulumruptor sp.]|nr:ABC transporter permease [Candidatus Amulumruptor sp.]
SDTGRVFRNEMNIFLHDIGVLLFFFALPLRYPVIYTLIYNPETVKEQRIAVVDESRTADSRTLTRMVDATEAIDVYAQCNTLDEARRLQNNHEVYAILHIPADYAKKIGRGEQANVTYYSDMSLLLRLRTAYSALVDVQLALGADIRAASMKELASVSDLVPIPQVSQEAIMLGDPTQGFASFIIPGIVILILQQSMLLGVTMLAAGSSERRRRNGYFDPLAVSAPPSASVIGKALCYTLLYLPCVLYVTHLVPMMFSLPHVGVVWEYLVYLTPMLLSTAFLGIALSVFVTERESSMLVIVFSSVIFLFISGLTWPVYAMNSFWQLIGACVPARWGIDGFLRMNSNGASIFEQTHSFLMMWILVAVYFVLAYVVTRYRDRGRRLVPDTAAA